MPFRPMFTTELDDDDVEFPEPQRRPDGRWPTIDSAERAIRHPGTSPLRGDLRDEVLARKAAAELALRRADRDLAEVMSRRRLAARRIDRCNLALTGTHQLRDDVTGEVIQRLGWAKRIPFDDPQPPVDLRRVKAVSGRQLRDLIGDLLDATGTSLTIPEIERLLRLQHLVPAGHPSRTISDAVRGEVEAGRIVRVRRGCYRRP
ncbi:MAG: hypothetical protein ACXWCM_03260 [Acidimicrobiales bacterium]